MHRTHISGKYKCANLATGVGEMISVLTGVLSAVCTQELWVMRQVYQDFFIQLLFCLLKCVLRQRNCSSLAICACSEPDFYLFQRS